MRVSELSRRSGVPVATIKYYLRERLLSPGTPLAPNQADYGDEHLRRLRLIRTLIEIGGLGIAAIRRVLEAIADESVPVHDLLGVAHRALGRPPEAKTATEEVVHACEEVDSFLARLGWQVSRDAPGRRQLADALVALRRLGWDTGPEVLTPYAKVADSIARRELKTMHAAAPRAQLVEQAVVGTVIFEVALAALRRLAQAHHYSGRFGVADRTS